MSDEDVQYISDKKGDVTGVIVPIELWKEIVSELETQYLLKSDAMAERLREARSRHEGIPLEEAMERLGIK